MLIIANSIHQVASNTIDSILQKKYFGYNKLKTSTLTLHVTNRKAHSPNMYKLCISKKARYTELENF